MRGLQRLRGSASALSTCSAPTIRSTPAASLLKNELAAQTHLCSRRQTQTWNGLRVQRRCLSATPSRFAKGTVVPIAEESRGVTEAEAEEETEIDEYEAGAEEIETDLVAPPPRSVATAPERILDLDYVPADTAEGLEEVGGFEDWWDRPGHWGDSKKYVGFGPQEKVTDRALLEVLTKRAVVEALVLKRHSENKIEPAAALSVTGGEEELLDAAKVEVVAGPDGTATLKEGDYEAVWESLKEAREEDVYQPAAPEISAEAAKELVKSWDAEWKSAQLKDPVVKFYIAKRIQRLTGHIISDSALMGISTVRQLINHLAQPPKAKKLIEEIEATGILKDLPNVQVFPRRVTPVDKEKMVGRWKIIERELQKRNLPVFGTGGYRKAVEKRWIQGGV